MKINLIGAVALAVSCVILAACGSADVASAPVVETADGERLRGVLLEGDGEAAVFKGVPYAAPPVDQRRWRPPAPLVPRDGIQQATDFGNACVQHPGNTEFYRDIAETLGTDPGLVPDFEPMSEDCLYLNLWTTNLGGDELQPVMVWIHGGSNVAGSGAEPPYDGANLARRGAVVINFNYRLGVFGFLAHPALSAESENHSSGNYALLDQIALLQWVQRNAASFGGDPARVTIFGESAGATDVAYLMVSPLARGLFHRAIIQSGGYAVSADHRLEEAEAVGEKLAEALGAADADDVLGAMRAVDAEEVLRITGEAEVGRVNSPNVDGWVLTDAPGRVFAAGGQAHVPLIAGFNADEWGTMRRYWPDVTVEGLQKALRTSYGELADQAMAIYPAATDVEAFAAADDFQTDLYFACPARFIADRMEGGTSRAFFYTFTRVVPAPGGEKLGAFHGAEVPYAFDSLAKETWIDRNEVDEALADAMADSWVRFAATGDPNGDGAVTWPNYDFGSRAHIVFGDEIETAVGVRDEQCELFENLQRVKLGLGG
jgi:para-nitrobenzyl esterase